MTVLYLAVVAGDLVLPAYHVPAPGALPVFSQSGTDSQDLERSTTIGRHRVTSDGWNSRRWGRVLRVKSLLWSVSVCSDCRALPPGERLDVRSAPLALAPVSFHHALRLTLIRAAVCVPKNVATPARRFARGGGTRWPRARPSADRSPAATSAHAAECKSPVRVRRDRCPVSVRRSGATHRVVFCVWLRRQHRSAAGSSTIEITFYPEGDDAIVRLRHDRLPWDVSREQHAMGWRHHYLERVAIAAWRWRPRSDWNSGRQSAALAAFGSGRMRRHVIRSSSHPRP